MSNKYVRAWEESAVFAIASLFNICNNLIFFFPPSPPPASSRNNWFSELFESQTQSIVPWTTLPSIVRLFRKSCCPSQRNGFRQLKSPIMSYTMAFLFLSQKSTFWSLVPYSQYKEKSRRKTSWNIYLSTGPTGSLLLRFKDLFQKLTWHCSELLPFLLLLPADQVCVGCVPKPALGQTLIPSSFILSWLLWNGVTAFSKSTNLVPPRSS